MATKKLSLAVVVWKDHTSNSQWVGEGAELDDASTLHEIISVGWIKEDTAEKIVLVGAVDTERGDYSVIQTIGKGLVVSVKILRGPRK